MIETADRFVAHFDVLGMKALVERDHSSAWQTIERLYQAQTKNFSLKIQSLDDGSIVQDRIVPVVFSDTILAFTKGSEDADVKAIVYLSCELFFSALHASIPLRGGISYGQLTWDEERKLFAGPPLGHAYELGETAQWLGVVVDPLLELRSKRLGLRVTRDTPLIVPWEVPLKSAKRERRYVIDWVGPHRQNLKVRPPLSVEQFYSPFEHSFGNFASLRAEDQAKYRHTVEFFNAKIAPFAE